MVTLFSSRSNSHRSAWSYLREGSCMNYSLKTETYFPLLPQLPKHPATCKRQLSGSLTGRVVGVQRVRRKKARASQLEGSIRIQFCSSVWAWSVAQSGSSGFWFLISKIRTAISSASDHLHGGYFKVWNNHFRFFLADFMCRQLPMADVFEELSITLSLLIFSTPSRIAGNSSEIHYLLPPRLFQTRVSALIFKLLTLEGEFF